MNIIGIVREFETPYHDMPGHFIGQCVLPVESIFLFFAVMQDAAGLEIARTRFAIVPSDGHAELKVTSAVTSASDIYLHFTGAPGFKLDWVGIYRKGDPSVYNYLGFAYTGARINGDLTFPAADLYQPLTPGEYEARLLFDDHYEVMAIAPFSVK